MPKYLITLTLTEHLADYANKLRLEFDQWHKRWLPAHVTLIPPTEGELTTDQIKQLKALRFSIDLHTRGWGSFQRDGANVVSLIPQADGLLEIWHQVARVVADGVHGSPVMPNFHVTIASKIPDAEFQNVLARVIKRDSHGHCRITQLNVYVWDPAAEYWKIA